jgi:hypothetical protein
MHHRLALFAFAPVLAQLGLVIAAMLVLLLWPPASGKMLLVPMLPGADAGLVGRAIDRGALLVDTGPLPGSLIVAGDRSHMASALLKHGVLVVAAPLGGCGPEGSASA